MRLQPTGLSRGESWGPEQLFRAWPWLPAFAGMTSEMRFCPRITPSAHDQHEFALQVAAFADPVRLGGVGKPVADDVGRPYRALVVKFEHAFEMDAVAGNIGPQYLHILAAWLKARGSGGNPYQPAARLQHVVGANLHLAADGVEHDIDIPGDLGEILRVVVDRAVGAEAFDIVVVAGTRRRQHSGAEIFRQLDREPGNATGAALD